MKKTPDFTKYVSPKLARAVYRHMLCENKVDFYQQMLELRKHGIEAGFHGFIYIKDVLVFWRKHHKLIKELILRHAENLGYPNWLLIRELNHIQFILNVGSTEICDAFEQRFNKKFADIYERFVYFAVTAIANEAQGVKDNA